MKIQPRFIFSASLLSAFIATSAQASTDNYLETQISTFKMASIVRHQFARNSTFCPYQIECPYYSWNNTPCVVDHFELGAPGTWSLYTQHQICAGSPYCTTKVARPATLSYRVTINEDHHLCIRQYDSSGLPPGTELLDTMDIAELTARGVVYCRTLCTCIDQMDYRRASEWTEAIEGSERQRCGRPARRLPRTPRGRAGGDRRLGAGRVRSALCV